MYQNLCLILFIFLNIANIIANNVGLNSTDLSINEYTCNYCTSNTLILNCSSIVHDLLAFENCSSTLLWETVDFSIGNMQYFDSTKLLSLSMKRLLLHSNQIESINNNSFDRIADIIIELNLEMNKLKTVSSTWLNSKFIKLKILNLGTNEIDSFLNLDDVYLPNLENLNLSHNQIKLFPNHLQHWTSLIKLDLSYNQLSNIPRFAFKGLNNLTWLSFASNRNLTCIVQDSFKHLKSLSYLDLSDTNFYNLDGCVFIQLTNLKVLRFEYVTLNCTSCWLPIARKRSLKILGECIDYKTKRQFDDLTYKQFEDSCLKSSIDCSVDTCEPDSITSQQLTFDKKFLSTKSPYKNLNSTWKIILIICFSIILFILLFIFILFLYRWRQGKTLFCCKLFQEKTKATVAEETRRRRQHHKQIISSNPTVIESVVTHGANMNVPSYSHDNNGYLNEQTQINKRKLYNPMFADSPTLEIRNDEKSVTESNDSTSQNSQFYSEKL